MRTIAVLNQKGGVGKTTTVANIAAALAAMGSKVIAIDLDPQAHLTIHLGFEPQSIAAGSYKVLTQSAKVEQEILLCRLNLWLLPANINLVGAETELVSVVGREIILREAIEEVGDEFDYCFIDCPPSLGLLTLNALAAAQEVLIPLQPHFLALQGFGKLLQTIELVNRRINPDLKVEGVLLCMFDSRASLPNEVKADIEQFLDNARPTDCAWANARILPTFIRRNIKLAEAPSYGQTIFEYEPNCHGAEDYKKVAEFIHSQSQSPERADTSAPAPVERIQAEPPQPPRPVPQPAAVVEDRNQAAISSAALPQANSQRRPDPKPQPVAVVEDRNQAAISSAALPQANSQTRPDPKPQAVETNQYRPEPATDSKAETSHDSPVPPQPVRRLSSTYEYHAGSSAGNRPVINPNPQSPPRPNNTNGLAPQPSANNKPVINRNPQSPPRPNAMNGLSPKPPINNRLVANHNAQSPPRPNAANGLSPKSPINNRPVANHNPQSPPQPNNTNGLSPQPPAGNKPVANHNAQIPPHPKRLTSTYEYRPQPPAGNKPVAKHNSQVPAQPKQAPATSGELPDNSQVPAQPKQAPATSGELPGRTAIPIKPVPQPTRRIPQQSAPPQVPGTGNQTQPRAVPAQTPPPAKQQPDRPENRQKPPIQIKPIPQSPAKTPPAKPASTTPGQNPPPAQQQ